MSFLQTYIEHEKYRTFHGPHRVIDPYEFFSRVEPATISIERQQCDTQLDDYNFDIVYS